MNLGTRILRQLTRLTVDFEGGPRAKALVKELTGYSLYGVNSYWNPKLYEKLYSRSIPKLNLFLSKNEAIHIINKNVTARATKKHNLSQLNDLGTVFYITDTLFHSGSKDISFLFLQRLVNDTSRKYRLLEDGMLGPKTIEALSQSESSEWFEFDWRLFSSRYIKNNKLIDFDTVKSSDMKFFKERHNWRARMASSIGPSHYSNSKSWKAVYEAFDTINEFVKT